VASRSGVVEGDHPGDPGIVTAARNPLSSTCPMTARESGVANDTHPEAIRSSRCRF
jgi:hypothetical protein